ncbi:FAD dependent oxidoreductase [Parasitella parasitica]|nr:FAD dependent oxidoreductase [Parasitella parasitica]
MQSNHRQGTYQAPAAGSKIIILTLALNKEKNYQVFVYDREQIPVKDGASNDISKVVRMDYGDEKLCMELAIDSIDIWNQWNQERIEEGLSPVYHNTGMLVFLGEKGLSENEKHSLRHIRPAGHADWIEELNGEQIVSRYPCLETAVKNGISCAYYNKVGGWCNSTEAIKHIYSKCRDVDVQFVLSVEGCFTGLETDKRNARSVIGIRTKTGNTHFADRVVMCTGSWTSSLIDMHKQVIATGQVVIHFRPSEEVKQILRNMPVWFGDFSRVGFYGFPDNGDGIFKVAKHSTDYLNPRRGDNVSVPRTQSTNEGDTIPVQAVRDFREYLHKFLPIIDSFQ